MNYNPKQLSKQVTMLVVVIVVLLGLFVGIRPYYRVWSQEMEGRAEFAKAEQNRKIKVEEAKANLEAEKLNAEAEIERARGVAEANRIIGEGLKGNEDYIKYLWVKGLNDGSGEVIYIPTEANIPILEASRLGKPKIAPPLVEEGK